MTGPVRRIPLTIPHDCTDGFYGAYWSRPEQYLSPAARAAISVFSRLGDDEVTDAVAHLHDDLGSGRLLDRPDLDLGYAILVADANRAAVAIPARSSGGGRIGHRRTR